MNILNGKYAVVTGGGKGIAPAMIDTDMMRSVPENLLKTYVTLIPARRPGSVDELATTTPDRWYFDIGTVNGGMFT